MIPKTDLPTYTVKIPSSNKEITVRPFVVKEEKLLLMAINEGAEDAIIHTTKQVVNNCIISGDFDVDKAPFFDVDYLFIFLRAKSVGESVEVNFKCNVDNDGSECGKVFTANVDISNYRLIKSDIDPKIPMDHLVVKMGYPPYSVTKTIIDQDTTIDKKVKIIAGSIEYIQDKEKFYTKKDMSFKHMVEFVEGMTQDKFKKLEKFVENFPSFVVVAEAKCPKCNFVHKIEYKDFISFFA